MWETALLNEKNKTMKEMEIKNEKIYPTVLYLSFNDLRIVKEVCAYLTLGGFDPIIINAEQTMRLCNTLSGSCGDSRILRKSYDNSRVLRKIRDLCKKHGPDAIIFAGSYGVETWSRSFGEDFTRKLVDLVGVVFENYPDEPKDEVLNSLEKPEFDCWNIEYGVKGMISEPAFCANEDYRRARLAQIYDAIMSNCKKGSVEISAD